MSLGPEGSASPEAAGTSLRTLLSFDPDMLQAVLQQGSMEHIQIGAGRFHGQVAHTATPGSRVDWGRYTSLGLRARGDLARDSVTIGCFVSGQGDWRLFGSPARNGDLVVLPEGGELQVNVPPQAQWLSIQMPRGVLEAAGFDLTGLSSVCGWHMPRTRQLTMHAAILALAPGLAPPQAEGAAPDVDLGLLHADLCSRLLTELDWRMADLGRRHPMRLDAREAWRTVRRAEDYVSAQADLRIRIDELCVATNTSISKLDRAFMQVYGMGPQRYLLLRRFARVRRDLLGGPTRPGLGVTAVAARWGFVHLGRFASAYKSLFGESPSETARQASRHPG